VIAARARVDLRLSGLFYQKVRSKIFRHGNCGPDQWFEQVWGVHQGES
jgi:hypothetical protein